MLEQLTQVLQRDLVEECASPYRRMTMATPEGQKYAVARLRNRWANKKISMPGTDVVTVTDIRRGSGSTETFIELVVELGSPASYTVMVEFVDKIPAALLPAPPAPKKMRRRSERVDDDEGDGDGADA